MKSKRKFDKSNLFLLLPSLGFLFFLFIYPFIYGMYLSITNKDGEFTLAIYNFF